MNDSKAASEIRKIINGESSRKSHRLIPHVRGKEKYGSIMRITYKDEEGNEIEVTEKDLLEDKVMETSKKSSYNVKILPFTMNHYDNPSIFSVEVITMRKF